MDVILVGQHGTAILPKSLCDRLQLGEGDRLLARTEPDGSIRLIPLAQAVRSLRGILSDVEPNADWASELVAQRREDAHRERGGR